MAQRARMCDCAGPVVVGMPVLVVERQAPKHSTSRVFICVHQGAHIFQNCASACSAGGGSGGLAAKDEAGNDIKASSYLEKKQKGDYSLAQGLKVRTIAGNACGGKRPCIRGCPGKCIGAGAVLSVR